MFIQFQQQEGKHACTDFVCKDHLHLQFLKRFYRCDFLMDVNEWIKDECSDEGIHACRLLQTFITHLLVHIHQKKKKIALEIAAKIVSV